LRNECVLDNILQDLHIDSKSILVVGDVVNSVADLEKVDFTDASKLEKLNFNMNTNEKSGFSFEK
jgi:hypothetical protein